MVFSRPHQCPGAPMRAGPFLLAASVLAWCIGCGGADDARSAPAQTLVEELRIDGAAVELNRVLSIAVAPNGNVVVAHDGDYALTLPSPAGKLVRSFVRQGAGPGELKEYAGMGTVGDSLWICDLGQNRVTLFGSDGSLGRMIPLEANTEWVKTRPGFGGWSSHRRGKSPRPSAFQKTSASRRSITASGQPSATRTTCRAPSVSESDSG